MSTSPIESMSDLAKLGIYLLLAGVVLAIATYIVNAIGNAPGISGNPNAQAVVGNVTSGYNITASFIPIIVIVAVAVIVIAIILVLGGRFGVQIAPR